MCAKPLDAVDTESGSGWSGPILERSQLILDWLEVPGAPAVPFSQTFAWGEEGRPGGSPNHECGAWSGEAVRAVLGGVAAERDRAFTVLRNAYFPREIGPGPKFIGLRVSELFCPDNHTHQHDQGVSMSRVAAFKSGDSQLLARTAELLRVTAAAFKALATPNTYFMGSAGLRSPTKPLWFYGTAFLRQLMGQVGPMPSFINRPQMWREPASVAVRALRFLQRAGDNLGGAASVAPAGCKIKFAMTVYRGPNSHLVILPRPKVPVTDVCDWVQVPWGLSTYQETSNRTTFGLNWQTPPPRPPAGAVRIDFPATYP